LSFEPVKHADNDRASATLIAKADTLAISGSVHFDNANRIFEQGKTALKGISAPVISVDLSGLTQSHTVLLAVIVQWIRGLAAGQQLHLANVPSKLKSIIETSRLQEIL
jgi:ABC-type transporter Mla MlaB component